MREMAWNEIVYVYGAAPATGLCKRCATGVDRRVFQGRVPRPLKSKTLEKVMKKVASTDAYTIYQRRDGRYAVTGADKAAINGADKVAILLQHELIKAPPPKAPEPEAAAETADEASAEEAPAEEAPAEEAPAEEAPAEEASADEKAVAEDEAPADEEKSE
jgi:hypothetical protein